MLRLVTIAFTCILLTGSAFAQTVDLSMENDEVFAGETFTIPLLANWSDASEGFSLSISFPPAPPIQDLALSIDNTIVGSLDADFVQANVFFTNGEAVIGVLIDSLPPFGEPILEPVGIPLAIAEITGSVLAGIPAQTIAFDYVDGLGQPPTNNTFVVATNSIVPSSMTGGILTINETVSTVPTFIRGDSFLNNIIDISDIIHCLIYIFVDGDAPFCMDAADANDDGNVDVADAIYTTGYLFLGGPMPPAPFTTAGEDPTPDALGCDIWIQ